MAKVSLTTITSRYASVDALNANFEALEEALENTLSRDGSAPNAMGADLDMDSNRILNLPTPTTSGEPIPLSWAVANYADFQTVAGLDDEIEALAAIVTEIVGVYGGLANIATVASGIANVNAVGSNITSVNTVATNISNVNNVNSNIADVSTVATNIANVNTVGSVISNVNTVAGSIASVNTVSGISSDVTAVALINGDVTTVAGISSDVTAVALDATDIGTVATNIANVNTVAGISGNVTTVAGDTVNVGIVAGDITNVNTVAGISADVSDVAGISTNVTTVAGIASNVSSVAANNADISTVAANITDVNSFADTYFISATAPGAPTAGDLWYDTSVSSLKWYNGSSWEIIEAVNATTVDAAGAVMNSDTTTASMSFVVDEDTFASNSDTKVPTQQSVKAYVDNATAAALHYHDPVRLESPIALTANYDNGLYGVGATLTNSGTQEALVIDGVAAVVNDRVLLYTQTNAAHNGVYTVTDIGSVSTNWVLTRATDADSHAPSDPNSLGTGDSFYVQEGNTGAGESYVLTTQGDITFGTTNLTFSQFSATPQYTGTTNIDVTGLNISLTTPTAPADGEVLTWVAASSAWEPAAGGGTYTDASGNTFLGEDTLASLSTGSNNVSLGKEAHYNLLSGNENVAIGYQAGRAVAGSSGTISIGRGAHLYGGSSSGSPGGQNVSIGMYASQNSGGGGAMVHIGSYAGQHDSGGQSIAIGTSALANNQQNVWSGAYNIGIGYNAMSSNATGGYNTALGRYAGYLSGTGTYNVFIGDRPGYSNLSGSRNVFIGAEAAYHNQNGSYITNIGYGSRLYPNTNSNYCTTIGALSQNSGEYSVSVGHYAGYNNYSYYYNNYNTFVGNYAGHSPQNGVRNTFLGYYAGANYGMTGSNNTCIGYNAQPPGGNYSNTFTLGDIYVNWLRCNDTTISTLSDERDKTNIQDITWGLDFINDVRPVTFQWNRRDGSMGDTKQAGFIAQELYEVELKHSSTEHIKMVNFMNPNRLEAAPMRMFPALVKAVQELSAQVETLKAEIATLKGE